METLVSWDAEVMAEGELIGNCEEDVLESCSGGESEVYRAVCGALGVFEIIIDVIDVTETNDESGPTSDRGVVV